MAFTAQEEMNDMRIKFNYTIYVIKSCWLPKMRLRYCKPIEE